MRPCAKITTEATVKLDVAAQVETKYEESLHCFKISFQIWDLTLFGTKRNQSERGGRA